MSTDPIGDMAEGAVKPKAIPTIGASEIFAPLPPLVWTCEGLRIPTGGVVLFAGYGDSAKSMFVQYLMLCIVLGLPVFGRFPVRQQAGVWFDYEQGARLSRERFIRLGNGLGSNFADIPEDALRLACFPDTYLDAKDAEEAVRATIEARPVGVLGFDSFKASCPDTDENSSAARKPLDMLTRVLGERIGLGIHHARKPPQEFAGNRSKSPDPRMAIRGNGALYDGVVGAFVLERERDDQNSPVRVHHVKERVRGRRLETFGFRVEDIAHGGDPHWGLRLEHVEADALNGAVRTPHDAQFAARCQAVFALVLKGRGVSKNAVTVATPLGERTVARVLHHLVETGHIVGKEERRGKTTGTFHYPAPGKTEYTAAAAANGVGVDDEDDPIAEMIALDAERLSPLDAS